MNKQWRPPHQDNPVMLALWAAFVQWAYNKEEIRKQFEDDTGVNLDSLDCASAIERMVDDASGRTELTMQLWCEWVTENWWGHE